MRFQQVAGPLNAIEMTIASHMQKNTSVVVLFLCINFSVHIVPLIVPFTKITTQIATIAITYL